MNAQQALALSETLAVSNARRAPKQAVASQITEATEAADSLDMPISDLFDALAAGYPRISASRWLCDFLSFITRWTGAIGGLILLSAGVFFVVRALKNLASGLITKLVGAAEVLSVAANPVASAMSLLGSASSSVFGWLFPKKSARDADLDPQTLLNALEIGIIGALPLGIGSIISEAVGGAPSVSAAIYPAPNPYPASEMSGRGVAAPTYTQLLSTQPAGSVPPAATVTAPVVAAASTGSSPGSTAAIISAGASLLGQVLTAVLTDDELEQNIQRAARVVSALAGALHAQGVPASTVASLVRQARDVGSDQTYDRTYDASIGPENLGN